jgi:lysophospholipase L1-like esterase
MISKNNFNIIIILGVVLLVLGLGINQFSITRLLPFLEENLNMARKVLLLLFNIVVAGIAVLMIRFKDDKKKIAFSVFLFFLVLVISLVGVEILVRLLVPHSDLPYFSEYPYERSPYIGLTHKANYEGVVRSKEFDNRFKTNSEGFRSSEEFITGDDQNKVIAVLGDSFVESFYIGEENHFIGLLESDLKEEGISQIQNYGISSIGFVHYLQTYKYYTSKHNPDIVIICIFALNDFQNSSPKLEGEDAVRPRYILNSSGEIENVGPFKTPDLRAFSLLHQLDRLFEYSASYQFLNTIESKLKAKKETFPTYAGIFEEPWSNEWERAYNYSSWSFKQLIGKIREDSAIPLVVIIPSRLETDKEEWEALEELYYSTGGENKLDKNKTKAAVERLAEELKVELISPSSEFEEAYYSGNSPYLQTDRHLSSFGHQLLASILSEKVSKIINNLK